MIKNFFSHGAEGADRHTGAAADTFIVIHFDSVEFIIAGNRMNRTNTHAGRILALLTGHGDINPFHG